MSGILRLIRAVIGVYSPKHGSNGCLSAPAKDVK